MVQLLIKTVDLILCGLGSLTFLELTLIAMGRGVRFCPSFTRNKTFYRLWEYGSRYAIIDLVKRGF